MIQIAVAQLNPTVGDIASNIHDMRAAAEKASAEGARMVVFPELAVTGYYPGDLLDKPEFMERVEAGIEALKKASRLLPGVFWVIGAPTPGRGPGKLLRNSLLVLLGGDVVLQYDKQLLPTYNIFDERRHFEPGTSATRVLDVDGTKIAFVICEDAWNDDGLEYVVNPLDQLVDLHPDLIVSINASPSHVGKREHRHALFARLSKRHQLPLLYVNQVGGQDQLVYDGASFAVTPLGGVVFECVRFESVVTTLTFTNGKFLHNGATPLPVSVAGLSSAEFYRRQIVLGLRDYARRCGFKQAVVGSSGGIDSALTLALAVEAMGAENVVAITMPSVYSSEGSVSDSAALCANLGIRLHEHSISELVSAYKVGFERAFTEPLAGVAFENVQARIRGTVLMEYSNQFGHLLLTTGNKSEISVGYCTLYGDTNGGLGLIGDLYKTEVFDLTRHLNEVAGFGLVPWAIIDKPPSAELAPDQKDTDSLPAYELLDPVLRSLIEGGALSSYEQAESARVMEELAVTEPGRALVQRIKRMISRNEYKRRQAPPVLRVRARAFGAGRQMPIAALHN